MRVPRLVMLILLVGSLMAACAAPATSRRVDDPGVIGAIVTYIDPYDGYLVAEWPGGRTPISMDPRELARYRVGDDIALDAARRPVPRR